MLALYPKPESFIGKEFDGYRIDAVLGSGGMGIVFKATQLELSRQVALKVISPSLTQDESFWNQFKVEAQALAKIHHPNIVVIYNFRPSDHGFYIAMEYVNGTPFSEYISRRGKVAWPESIVLFKQILSALDSTHKTGIIHRDIKPSNLIVNDQNFVKITDFGLAKVHEAEIRTDDSTVSFQHAGTLLYMPPEEIKGSSKGDHRGDIYSVGMTMYEALAGRLPFDKTASGYNLQKSIVEEPFTHINKFVPALPKPLARVIMKAIEKEPHKRFQSAGEMLTALERCSPKELPEKKSQPFLLNPIITSEAKRTLKKPVVTTALGILVLILLVFLPLASLFNISSKPRSLAEQIQENGIALSIEQPTPTPKKTNRNQESRSDSLSLPRSSGGFEKQLNKLIKTAPVEALASTQTPAAAQAATPNGFFLDTGSLRVTSKPAEAEVVLDGTVIGLTPVFMDELPAGSFELIIRKENYQSTTIQTEVRPLEIAIIEHTLAPVEGVLSLRINPPSHVFVDGKKVTSSPTSQLDQQLPAASHLVSITNKELGEWTQTISVQKEDTTTIAVNFEEKIKIPVTAFDEVSRGLHAEIYIDNQPTGIYTPAQLSLAPGKHTISVKSDGYTLAGDPVTQNYEADVVSPLRFTLEKKP